MLGNKKRDKKALSNQPFLELIGKFEKDSPIKIKDFEKYLLFINKIYGYNVDYKFEPIKDIKNNEGVNLVMTVQAQKAKRHRDYFVRQSGTSDLGGNQFAFATKFFNTIANDSLTINAGTSNKPKRFKMITGGYSKQLNSYGTSEGVLASYYDDEAMNGMGYNYVMGRLGAMLR